MSYMAFNDTSNWLVIVVSSVHNVLLEGVPFRGSNLHQVLSYYIDMKLAEPVTSTVTQKQLIAVEQLSIN